MRFQKTWPFYLILIFAALDANAGDNCAPVDLRPLIGAPLHQGDSGYCFAHTSAVLIRAKLGISVSPMQLATHYILANPEEISGAADPEVKKRVTSEMIRTWRIDRNLEPQNYRVDRILGENGLLDTGGDELQALLVANFLGLCPDSRLPTGAEVYKEYLESIRKFDKERWQKGIPPEEMNRPIGEVKDPEARAMAWSYRHWVEERCGTPFFPALPLLPTEISLAKNLQQFRRLEAMHFLTADQARNIVMKAVDEHLARGVPVAFGYSMGDLMPGSALMISKKMSQTTSEVDHASIFAGRRRIGHKCYYYVRNSFGESPEGYRPQFKGRIEQGGVWVLPEEIPSLYSAVWLD